MNNTVLVTGAAGFIGTNFVQRWLGAESDPIVALDALTYAGVKKNLDPFRGDARFSFVQGDINDAALVADLFDVFRPRALVHFAAESHVDRSIAHPDAFIRTNINGTFTLLQAALTYCKHPERGRDFRFVHVSTDEVYGSLGPEDPAFTESSGFAPNSPYAASKASSDLLVRAYFQTYRLPAIITHCSNNYGPHQFPEKLIPLLILNALDDKPLPIYGDGLNIRDWLYVTDHCDALRAVLEKGRPGESYNIGGHSERANIEVVNTVCGLLDVLRPPSNGRSYSALLRYVTDRPGHDRRYAIDANKIRRELGWEPKESFRSAIRKTVQWYLDNPEWVHHVRSGEYRRWMAEQYAVA